MVNHGLLMPLISQNSIANVPADTVDTLLGLQDRAQPNQPHLLAQPGQDMRPLVKVTGR